MRVSQKQSYKSTTTISKDNSNFNIMDPSESENFLTLKMLLPSDSKK